MIAPKPRPSPIVWIRISLSGLILWAGLACASQAAYAQQEQDAARLVGVVTDRLTSRPAIGAEIQVVGLPLRTLTDEEGWFLLEGIPPGERIVEISYLGLTSSQYTVELPEGTTRLDFEIVTPPFELEELIVEVRLYRTVKMQGFQRRRERQNGHFIDREGIEKEAPVFLSDLLRGIPGVRVEWTLEGDVRLTMGHGLSACEPDLYIDGSPSHAARINDWLPNLIEAVEVYNRAFDRPMEFRANRCGAILLWTRERM